VAPAAANDEARRHQVDVAICASILVEGCEETVLSKARTNRARAHQGESKYRDISAILSCRRQNEPPDVQQSLKTRFVNVWVIDLPAINTCDHERLLFDRH
jgi:hypothetical protein